MTNTQDNPNTLSFPDEYKPDSEREGHEYNLPSTDAKGHSDQIKFLTPQGQVSPRVKAIVQSGNLGYRGEGDFYRRAVRLLLLADEAETGISPAVGRQLQLLNEVNQTAERARVTRDSVAELGNHVEQCLAEGEYAEAGELLGLALAVVEGAPEGPWKRRVSAEFAERFKMIMGVGGVENGD